jgi:hypothetical protein
MSSPTQCIPGAAWLRGAVDGHIHACPHINARRLDVLEAVRQAAEAGMRAIGLMDNFANSAGLAALAMRELGHLGVEVWGGLIMEPPAGGVSAQAVRIALDYGYGGPGSGARFISFPTHHTRHTARQEGRSAAYVDQCFHVPDRGQLPDPLPEILDLAAARDVVLNLGHLGDAELVRLAEAARASGVRRLLVPANHAGLDAIDALVRLDAYLEFSFFFVSHATQVGLTHVDSERHRIEAAPLEALMQRIRAAPGARVILSSDAGSALLPPPVESLRCFLMLLHSAGLGEEDLITMTHHNPARLFRVGAVERHDTEAA